MQVHGLDGGGTTKWDGTLRMQDDLPQHQTRPVQRYSPVARHKSIREDPGLFWPTDLVGRVEEPTPIPTIALKSPPKNSVPPAMLDKTWVANAANLSSKEQILSWRTLKVEQKQPT